MQRLLALIYIDVPALRPGLDRARWSDSVCT